MRTNQSNKYTMFKAVIALLKAGTAKLAIVPALTAAFAKFEQIVETIGIKESERSDNNTGKLEFRDETEDILVEALVPIAAALAAFASATKDAELFEKARVKKNFLYRLRDNELVLKAKAILALAQQYFDKLGEYAITTQSLANLQQDIVNFETAMANLDKGHSGRSGARMAVHDAFDAADDILKNQIDRMMETVKKTDPQFYNEYISARVIRDLGRSRSKENGQKLAQTAAATAAVPAK